MIPLALTYARRELRGGLKGFRILMACLALGVAAIAASGSLKAAFHTALNEDSRRLLGGDLDLRQSYRPMEPEQRQLLDSLGVVAAGLDLRAMAHGPDSRRLVELKGVDPAIYPLVGTLELDPPLAPAEAFALRNGVWGAVADPNLLANLGIKLGDRITLGNISLQIRATITREPDRMATALSFGPRLMAPVEAVEATGLIQPGSLMRWTYQVALKPGLSATAAKHLLGQRFPEAGWQLRDTTDAAPGVARFLDNLTAFLTLVGLTALLVGGIGVANAVKAYLDGRVGTIAVLKAVGAPSRLIFATYGSLVGLLAGAGIIGGLALGALIPVLVVQAIGDKLPLAARMGLYPGPLAVAAGFGLLTAGIFTLWPLARAKAVPATALFRQLVTPLSRWPDRPTLGILTLASVALMALTVLSADKPGLAASFIAAAVITLALFRGLAWGLSRAAAACAARRTGLFAHPTGRLALANLHRPGSAVVSVVLSLGLGLTVLVTIALIEGNLAKQFGERMPAEAPSFFFIDIQPDQLEGFDRIVRGEDALATVEQAPMVRGRITR
ncbi:MAG: ABC transporter permease, partial [Magnetospirillum sp.]|nr:ABC transporter permease [Magnetospirillum sp.]